MRTPIVRVESRAVVIERDDIDTDQIIPARFLKGVDRTGLGQALFADWRRNPDGSLRDELPLNRPEAAGCEILVTGRNFGCGSSREHAVWALAEAGFRVVVAASFGDIFRANALKNGLLPVEVSAEQLVELHRLLDDDPARPLTVDLLAGTLTAPGWDVVPFSIDAFSRRMLLEGTDELGHLLALEPAIKAYEARHPAPVTTTRPLGDRAGVS
ncbi:MAG TPA: 3-isopropylmalate dehydratase small subunit [Candidatus Limnocylindrales bacterium]|nr:3-isopropylmalate dehydratase small subunit [Candidatus Limnocylindrales bacterium]